MVVFLIFHVGLYLGSSGELEATLLTPNKVFFSLPAAISCRNLGSLFLTSRIIHSIFQHVFSNHALSWPFHYPLLGLFFAAYLTHFSPLGVPA